MTEKEPKGRRRYYKEAREARQALLLIRPYADRFEGWNMKAAHAGGAIMSERLGSPDKEVYRASVRELRSEVASAYEEFEAAAASAPEHSRIEDVRHAFRRLLKILEWVHD